MPLLIPIGAILEIVVFILVGKAIGVLPVVGLVVLSSVLGGALLKHQGLRAWRALRQTTEERRVPHKELADGALIVVGGMLMIIPGLVSSVVGVLLLLPFTRPAFRGMLLGSIAGRVPMGEQVAGYAGEYIEGRWQQRPRKVPSERVDGPHKVIDADVVEDEVPHDKP